jgi:hypothetical protein
MVQAVVFFAVRRATLMHSVDLAAPKKHAPQPMAFPAASQVLVSPAFP